jgi:ABC-type nitrate/sulfonate/bicarbonate transport system substrate-binding protein
MVRSRFHTVRALAALLAVGLIAAGCGDDDDADVAADTTTTEAATEAEGEEPADGGAGTADGVPESCAPEGLESTELRLATSPPEFDTVTDAHWLEVLADAGLEVETFEFESSPDTVRAVAAGEGDVINTSPLAIMQYIQQSGGGLRVMAVELLKTDYLLVTTPDVAGVEDVEGRVVGISEPGDLSDSLTRLMLGNAGVDVSSIQFAEIGGTGARVAALAAGQIQAGAVHAADALAAAEEFGLTAEVRYVDYIPDYAQRFLAASPDWLDENPQLAQCLVDAMIDTQRWSMENKEEYVELGLSLVEGLPEHVADEVYDLFHDEGFFAVDGGLPSVEPTMQVEVDQGNLDEGGSLADFDSWVDPTFVESYLERNGEYEG